MAKSPSSIQGQMCRCWDREVRGRRGKREERREKTCIAWRDFCHAFIALFKTGTTRVPIKSVPHLTAPALLSFARTLKHKEKNDKEWCLMLRQKQLHSLVW